MRLSILPMVDCQWGQSSPFNGNLKIGNRYMLVGCTALAIAQICYYWMVQRGYHRGCKAVAKYTTATNKYTMSALPSITVFDWENLVDVPRTADEKKAVATLCEYIGKALKSDYSRTDTSASRTAVENVFNYYLRLGDSKHYYESTTGKVKFDELIYDDLAHGRPVFMTGQSSKSGGHSFVIDGYDADTGKYHVNWGWSGKCDDWYKLSALTPGGENYNGSKMAVCKIQPLYKLGDADGDGRIGISDVMTVINAMRSGKISKQTDINSDGKLTQEDVDLIEKHLIDGKTL